MLWDVVCVLGAVALGCYIFCFIRHEVFYVWRERWERFLRRKGG